MSTPPQEADTRTVDLSRTQRWVVHHALVNRADNYIDDDEPVPPWLIHLLEAIEDGEDTLTVRQGRNLVDLLQDELADYPPRDAQAATDAVSELETALT